MTDLVENALTDTTVKYVEESTFDEPPTDPAWQPLSNYILTAPGAAPDLTIDDTTPVGEGDRTRHDRGPGGGTVTVEHLMQQFFVASDGTAQHPIGDLIVTGFDGTYPSHTTVHRKEVAAGGNDDAGFHQVTVGTGGRPTTGEIPGDPSQGQPIALTIEWTTGSSPITYILHQPSGATTLQAESSSDDSMTLTVEGVDDTDTTTTEDLTVGGSAGATNFVKLTAAYLSAEPEGNITLTDGSGTTLLTITGRNTDGVEGDRGIPVTGGGSEPDFSALPDPSAFHFLRTSSTFPGTSFGDRVHGLDVTIEREMQPEPTQSGRGRAVDPGPRTVSIDSRTAGVHESASAHERFLNGETGTITYDFDPSGDLQLKFYDAQPVDVDPTDYQTGDANVVFATTFEPSADPRADPPQPAIEAINNTGS